jgi:restriction system protein
MNLAPLVRFASRLVNAVRLVGRRRHQRNVATSRRLLALLSTFPHEGAVINYLRKVDPFVMEELVLSLFEAQGSFVLRNRAYTGDGGVDGAFYWPGRGWYAVQCKRYAAAINPGHARAFRDLARKHYRGGVLVHTGRTGDQSQEAMAPAGLFLLSGSTLTQSIKGHNALLLMERRKGARTQLMASAA